MTSAPQSDGPVAAIEQRDNLSAQTGIIQESDGAASQPAQFGDQWVQIPAV